MNLRSLHDLLVHELHDLHSAEQQIIEALPKMARSASSNELRDAFQEHLDVTRVHVDRLERIFNELGVRSNGQECRGMKGLIAEGEEIIQEQGGPATKDAALIGAAQRVEHYEIAAYGTARTHADELGYDKVASLLQQTLDEEGETDKKLTDIAEGGLVSKGVNEAAEQDV